MINTDWYAFYFIYGIFTGIVQDINASTTVLVCKGNIALMFFTDFQKFCVLVLFVSFLAKTLCTVSYKNVLCF